jgi:hypothetical protein
VSPMFGTLQSLQRGCYNGRPLCTIHAWQLCMTAHQRRSG